MANNGRTAHDQFVLCHAEVEKVHGSDSASFSANEENIISAQGATDSVLNPQRKEIQISNHFKKNRIRHLCAVQYGVALDQAFSPDPTDCPWVSEDGEAWVGRLGSQQSFIRGGSSHT